MGPVRERDRGVAVVPRPRHHRHHEVHARRVGDRRARADHGGAARPAEPPVRGRGGRARGRRAEGGGRAGPAPPRRLRVRRRARTWPRPGPSSTPARSRPTSCASSTSISIRSAPRTSPRPGADSACPGSRWRSTSCRTGGSTAPCSSWSPTSCSDGDTEVSVLIPRIQHTRVWHRLLHDRTADSIAETLSRPAPLQRDDRPLPPARRCLEAPLRAAAARANRTGGHQRAAGQARPGCRRTPAVPHVAGSTPIAEVQARRKAQVTGRDRRGAGPALGRRSHARGDPERRHRRGHDRLPRAPPRRRREAGSADDRRRSARDAPQPSSPC